MRESRPQQRRATGLERVGTVATGTAIAGGVASVGIALALAVTHPAKAAANPIGTRDPATAGARGAAPGGTSSPTPPSTNGQDVQNDIGGAIAPSQPGPVQGLSHGS